MKWLILLVFLAGCTATTLPKHYSEQTSITAVVIYADHETIQKEHDRHAPKEKVRAWTLLFGKGSGIIWCEKWDFYACGHELSHITSGSFHTKGRSYDKKSFKEEF